VPREGLVDSIAASGGGAFLSEASFNGLKCSIESVGFIPLSSGSLISFLAAGSVSELVSATVKHHFDDQSS